MQWLEISTENIGGGSGDCEVRGLISDILSRRERAMKIREIGRRHKKNKGIAKTKRNKHVVRFKGGKLQINGGGCITEIKDNTDCDIKGDGTKEAYGKMRDKDRSLKDRRERARECSQPYNLCSFFGQSRTTWPRFLHL